MPDALTGTVIEGNRTAATSQFWLRGAGFRGEINAHLQWLCELLGAVQVMPIATMHAEPFCLTLAKIAHSFAIAELGLHSFHSFLSEMIRSRDLSNRAEFIGGGAGDEPPSEQLHDVAFDRAVSIDPAVIAVRIRLLGILGTPTYHVAVGRDGSA